MAPSLQQEYSQQMKHHGYGHAFYEPKPYTDIQPGMCGYLDAGGNWTRMIDLGDGNACARQGFTPPRPPERARPEERAWGPKVSENVTSKRASVSAGVS